VLLGIVAALCERERSGMGQGHRRRDGRWGQRVVADDVDDEVDRRAARRARVVFPRKREVPPARRAAHRSIAPTKRSTASTWLFAQLLDGLGLSPDEVPNQFNIGADSEMRRIFTDRFASKSRDEWSEIFAGTDACVTPVLTWAEAAKNEHLNARSTLVRPNGVEQAAPAPRFSRTPSGPVGAPPKGATPLDEIGW
jgi:alpha-methylacyl-CoA racemase